MTHYLLAVHGPVERAEYGDYGSKEAMEAAFAATGAFNDRLKAEGYWVFAGGLSRLHRHGRRRPGRDAGRDRRPLPRDQGGHRGFLGHRRTRPRRRPQARGRRLQGVRRQGRGPSVRGPRLSRPDGRPLGAGFEQGGRAAVERVFREEYGRLIASLVRRFGDIDIAQEAAGQALVAALEKWPESGVPPTRRLAHHHRKHLPDQEARRVGPTAPSHQHSNGGPLDTVTG